MRLMRRQLRRWSGPDAQRQSLDPVMIGRTAMSRRPWPLWVERDQAERLFDSFPDHRAAPVGRTARLCDLPRGTPALEDHGHQNQLGLTDTWVAQAPSHRRHQLRESSSVCSDATCVGLWPVGSRPRNSGFVSLVDPLRQHDTGCRQTPEVTHGCDYTPTRHRHLRPCSASRHSGENTLAAPRTSSQ